VNELHDGTVRAPECFTNEMVGKKVNIVTRCVVPLMRSTEHIRNSVRSSL